VRGARLVSAILLVCATASLARAERDPSKLAAARSHYRVGRALFQSGRYREALAEFTRGYDLYPKPELRFAMAQACSNLQDYAAAVTHFERFLDEAPPGHPDRPAAIALLASARQAAAARASTEPAAPSAPAPAQAPPAPSVVPVAPQPPTAAPALAVTAASHPSPRRSFARRHWWIFPAVGVVAAGVAVGLALGLGGTSSPCAGTRVPCTDLMLQK
jgi:tetratricopeptide (TPR) repeat protein